MKGTVPQKIARLVNHLVTQPRYLSRYVTQSVNKTTTPLDLELPWFSYAAIDFLDTYLQSYMKVCEYGSGGSTLFFSRRVKSVYSIEDNAEWFSLVTNKVEEKNIRNVEVVLRPYDFKEVIDFHRS